MAKRKTKNAAEKALDKADKKLESEEPSFSSMLEDEAPRDKDHLGEDTGTVLANYSDVPDFGQEDVIIPRLKLAQGLTTEVQEGIARPGQWILTGFEPEDELTIVPLAFAKRRELRDPDTRDILCFSRDARTGEGTPGGECAVCPMNEWTESDDGKRVPPPCNFQYAYLVYAVDLDSMGALTFAKSGLSSGKMLNTIVAQRGMGRCAVKLSSSQRTGPNGKYHVPSVNPANVDAEVLDKAKVKASGDVVV